MAADQGARSEGCTVRDIVNGNAEEPIVCGRSSNPRVLTAQRRKGGYAQSAHTIVLIEKHYGWIYNNKKKNTKGCHFYIKESILPTVNIHITARREDHLGKELRVTQLILHGTSVLPSPRALSGQ